MRHEAPEVEELEKDIRLFSTLERRSGWARGLLVARRVHPPGHRPAPDDAGHLRLTYKEFALRSGTQPERVRAFWNAWERAAADGVVPAAADIRPGQNVPLPDESDVPWFGENGYYRSYEARMSDSERRQAIEAEAQRAGITPTDPIYMAQRTAALRTAILGDPKARAAATEALAELREREDAEAHEAATAYIERAQARHGGKSPVADIEQRDEDRSFTEDLIRAKLQLDALLRTARERDRAFADRDVDLIRAACASIHTTADWIATVTKPGQRVDDAALAAFLDSREGEPRQ